MRIHNMDQRSAEWLKIRLGIPTASKFDRIITPQGKRSGQARRLMYDLAYEQITQTLTDRDLSNVMHVQHGIANESVAVERFNQLTGLSTTTVGFMTDDDHTMGCSPDRIIVGAHEALEIKCPTGPIMCGYLIDGLIDAYKAQLQGQILIGNFELVHFFAWSPELPPYYTKVYPDPEFISALARYLGEFHRELTRGVAHIRSLGHWPRNAPSAFPEDDDSPSAA